MNKKVKGDTCTITPDYSWLFLKVKLKMMDSVLLDIYPNGMVKYAKKIHFDILQGIFRLVCNF